MAICHGLSDQWSTVSKEQSKNLQLQPQKRLARVKVSWLPTPRFKKGKVVESKQWGFPCWWFGHWYCWLGWGHTLVILCTFLFVCFCSSASVPFVQLQHRQPTFACLTLCTTLTLLSMYVLWRCIFEHFSCCIQLQMTIYFWCSWASIVHRTVYT